MQKARVSGTYVGTRARPVNGEDSDVVNSQTPHSQCTTQRSNSFIGALQHAIHRQCVLILACSFTLNVSDARGEVLLIDVFLALAQFHLASEHLSFIGQPQGDLVAAEGELLHAVVEVENGQRVFRGDLASD